MVSESQEIEKYLITISFYQAVSTQVELLWRRPNAKSGALREGLRLLRLAEFDRYNRAGIGGPSKRQPMNSLVSS